MRERSGKNSISAIAALILLAVFAAGILSVLLGGADVYKRLAERNTVSYDRSTCLQYLTNKIHQAPSSDAVMIADFGECESLVISENIKGNEYWTRIYLYEGWLMELFTAADSGLMPEDGEKIMPIESFRVICSDDLLQINIADLSGNEDELFLTLRGKEWGSYEK